MPRQTTTITDERLLAELDELPAALKVTEKQAALILGCAAETLRWKRRQQDQKVKEAGQGKPVSEIDLLPVQQDASRHAVRYKLGDVRRAANPHVGQMARDAAHKRREEGWMGFGGWLANADMDDYWTFAVVDGVPMDLSTSLIHADQHDWEEDDEEVVEMSLSDYLAMRQLAAQLAQASRAVQTLDQVTVGPAGQGALCPSCGKPHSGPCRF